MNIHARKLNLIEWVASLDDVKLINQIENLKHGRIGKLSLKPLSKKEYLKIIKESEEDIKSGQVYAHEDVVKYMKRKR
jgi:hypothetical protein